MVRQDQMSKWWFVHMEVSNVTNHMQAVIPDKNETWTLLLRLPQWIPSLHRRSRADLSFPYDI